MELDREQTIKALECCEKEPKDCPSCPLTRDYSPCSTTMAKNALSLINELTEENENLHATRTELTRVQEENERLRAENAKYEAENHAEFNKWLKLEEATKRHHAELFEEAKIAVKEDTVRKMQERLRFEIVNKPCKFTAEKGTVDFLNGLAHRQFEILNIVDQIAKEMLESGN